MVSFLKMRQTSLTCDSLFGTQLPAWFNLVELHLVLAPWVYTDITQGPVSLTPEHHSLGVEVNAVAFSHKKTDKNVCLPPLPDSLPLLSPHTIFKWHGIQPSLPNH